jgi:hypothetical protein
LVVRTVSEDNPDVSIASLTAPEAVHAAMDEFDELGRDPFLAKYGYGHAKRYLVRRDGKLYDSKAIAGVAVGFQYPDRGPMLNSEFSGGEGSVVRRLEELGFEIVDAGEDDDALVLPQVEVDAFAETMASEEYARDERDYKIAVHEVMSRLLAPETIERSEFPALLAGFFDRTLELADLGIEGELREWIDNAVGGEAFYRVTASRMRGRNASRIPTTSRRTTSSRLRSSTTSFAGQLTRPNPSDVTAPSNTSRGRTITSSASSTRSVRPST